MKINTHIVFLIAQLILIFYYLCTILFSIIIFPTNIVLGVICVLFLPGYNLLNLLKSKSSLIEKLGYTIILSLAIENVMMLLFYVFFYNFITWPEVPGGASIGIIFNPFLLILSIQIINLILILSIELKQFYFKKYKFKPETQKIFLFNKNISFNENSVNFKNLIVFICFLLSLILICISTIYSDVPNNEFLINYAEYRPNFTFFYRVPIVFYIFLTTSILSLTYLIFSAKNNFIILISVSAFLYCIWILPYLQIGNYFSQDSRYISLIYEYYLIRGISNTGAYGFCLLPHYGTQRNSTALLNAIVLTSATSMDIDFALWYLYPLIYMFIPFFFYSVFQKFSKLRDKNSLNLTILTLLVVLTPLYVKDGHNLSTGLLGVILFFMLVIEFYSLIYESDFRIKDCFIIILLYAFLCLTHFEECLYFLVLICIYGVYYSFLNLKNITEIPIYNKDIKDPLKNYAYVVPQLINNDLTTKHLKRNMRMLGLLLIVLLIVFYLSQEFFGWITHYSNRILKGDLFFIYELYAQTKIKISLS